MANITNQIASGLKRKGIVRVFWGYDKSKDVYEACMTFYGYENSVSAFGKLSKLPRNAELDDEIDYEDVCEITLKEGK